MKLLCWFQVGSVVRVRPFLEGEDAISACVQVNQRENTLVMKSPTTGATKPFKVSTVTPIACGQAEFYDTVGDELVDHVVHGLDCCVIVSSLYPIRWACLKPLQKLTVLRIF